jgi:hypothetical protein
MIPLSLSCHRCHQVFPSGVYLDKRVPRRVSIEGLVYECPNCRLRDTYFTREQRPWDAEGVPGARTVPPGLLGQLGARTLTGFGPRLWVGIAVGVLLAILGTEVVHAVRLAVLAVGL